METKLVFIHMVRTGGSYAGYLLEAAGIQLHCPWRQGKDRDWTRVELFQLARQQQGCVHSHSTAWDEELNDWYLKLGWTTFTIVRDPADQLTSLWHFMDKACGDINEFVFRQLAGEMVQDVDFHFWEIPRWWRSISKVILYQEDLYPVLVERLGLPASIPVGLKENVRERTAELASKTLDELRRSRFNARYLNVLGVGYEAVAEK